MSTRSFTPNPILKIRPGLCSLLLLALPGGLFADVSVPALIGNNMVIQRDVPVHVWGWADPGETVTVTMGKATATATPGEDRKWSVKLPKRKAGPAPDLAISGKNRIAVSNILAGDVWVCSGQSNMELGAARAGDAREAMADVDHPEIRIFYVPKTCLPLPQEKTAAAPANIPMAGSWQICTPETLAKDGGWFGFSAVGYRFGRETHDFTKAPVGLIGSYWGGTPAQAWTSFEALDAVASLKHYTGDTLKFRAHFDTLREKYKVDFPQWETAVKQWREAHKAELEAFQTAMKQWQEQFRVAKVSGEPVPPRPQAPKEPPRPANPEASSSVPTVLYNGMIAPLTSYPIKGVVWYQGENNAWSPVEYRALFQTMIADWRTRWGQGDFPFLFVQLANFKERLNTPSESDWATLREAQSMALSLPNTGMAVIIDIGDGGNIHPLDKFDVGRRLFQAARKVAYGDGNAASSPRYRGMKVEKNKIRVDFDAGGSGLAIGVPPEHFNPGKPRVVSDRLEGFAIAGADRKFVWADAAIDGNTVVVSSPLVPEPVAVRYAWADNPACNLYNKEGLAASPFRTDDWPVGEALKALQAKK